jgi:hypothetical protein
MAGPLHFVEQSTGHHYSQVALDLKSFPALRKQNGVQLLDFPEAQADLRMFRKSMFIAFERQIWARL